MMEKNHITKFLDEIVFNDLSENQLAAIRSHIPTCSDCHRAFQAAELTSLLLEESSNSQINVPPFFQAKVLNALREKQIVQKPIAVFWRWWQSSATLVLIMFLTMISLMAATYIGAHSKQAVSRQENSEVTLYSAETVILDQRPSQNLTTEQVFEVLDDDR